MSEEHTVSQRPEKQQELFFNKVAREYEQAIRADQYLLDLDIMERYTRLSTRHRVLDIATGTGKIAVAILTRFSNVQVFAVDLSEEMLRLANSKSMQVDVEDRLALVRSVAIQLPFTDQSFDLVVISYALHHMWKNWKTIFEQIRQVLKRDGMVVVLEVGMRHFIEALDLLPRKQELLKGRLSVEQVENAFRVSGFRSVCVVSRTEYQLLSTDYVADYLAAQGITGGCDQVLLRTLKQRFGDFATITNARFLCIGAI